jgi:hypothetical protein
VCRVTVLKLIGWTCCFLWAFAGVVGPPFQVPPGPPCALSGLSRQAKDPQGVSLVALPSCAHLLHGYVSIGGGVWGDVSQ